MANKDHLFHFSRTATIKDCINILAAHWRLPPHKSVLCIKDPTANLVVLDRTKTLQEIDLPNRSTLVIKAMSELAERGVYV
jgi:hypothetical protein